MKNVTTQNITTSSPGILRTTTTLDECCDDWTDIQKLSGCSPPTGDWRSNTGYGLMDIYVEAAGLPLGYRPHINVLHGQFVAMSDQWYHTSEAGFRSVPATFVHNEPDQVHLDRVLRGRKRVLVAPHPFHYVVRHYEMAVTGLNREGSVFFMPHTLGQPRPRVPVGHILQRLRELPEEYLPIDVCLHPNDVTESLISIFMESGFNVITAGHRHDPLFLHRFFWLCRRRRFAIMTDYGTQVWLSSLAGCEIHIFRDVPDMMWIPANNSLDYLVTPRSHYWPLWDALDSTDLDQVLVQELIHNLTGGNQWRSPEDLRITFQKAESWFSDWYGPDGQFRTPARFWVPVEPYIRIMRSIRIAALNRLSGRRGRWQPMCGDLIMKLIAYERASLSGNKNECDTSKSITQPIIRHSSDI